MDHPELKKMILDELSELKDIRRYTEEERGQTASLCYPRRQQFTEHALPKLFTAKGRLAMTTAVLGLMGNMISSTVRWFSLGIKTFEDPDKIYGLKDWLDKSRDLIMQEFSGSYLYESVQLALMDAITQGTSAMFMLDDTGTGQTRYKVVEPQEFYGVDDEWGNPERFFREYDMTARAALNYFGDEACPEIREKYKENPYELHKFIHAIFPRDERDPVSQIASNKKFASVYYSETDDAIVKESGYDDFPVIIHRWVKDSSSFYGGCPAFDCIESLKIYNKSWNNRLKQDDLLTNPPMMVAQALRGKFSEKPGARNYVDQTTADVTKPLYNGMNYTVMEKALESILQEIESAFHTDYFRMLINRDKQMTAREIIEVMGERASILIPVVERLQKEVMVPIVERQFKIMLNSKSEKKRLPNPPPALKKNDIKPDVNIEGPLSQAMKNYHEAEGMMRGLEVAAAIKQAFPGSEDNIDSDELMRSTDTVGMPARIIREMDDVIKLREQKLKEIEAMKAQQAQAAEADAYNKMKDSPGQGSPMQQYMQQAQQGNVAAMKGGRQ